MNQEELDRWVKRAAQVIADNPPTPGSLGDFKESPEYKALVQADVERLYAESEVRERERRRAAREGAAREKRAAQAAQDQSASKPTPPPRLVRKFPKK